MSTDTPDERRHWREGADYVTDRTYAHRLLGECDRGDLWAPSRRRPGVWDRRFHAWNPLHWPYWLRSRRRRCLVFLERGSELGSRRGR